MTAILYGELRRARRSLPRGSTAHPVRGRALAEAILQALESAIAAGRPLWRGTGGRLVRDLAAAGHLSLARRPCARTTTAAWALVCGATPLVQLVGARVLEADLRPESDPEDLERLLAEWRQRVAAGEEMRTSRHSREPADGLQRDASDAVDLDNDAFFEGLRAACADSAGPEMRTVLSPKIPAYTPSQAGVSVDLPRVYARGGTQDQVPVGPPAEQQQDAPPPQPVTLSDAAAAGARGRWVGAVLAELLAHPPGSPDLRGLHAELLARRGDFDRDRRTRAAVRRAIESLARRGLLRGSHGPRVELAAFEDPELVVMLGLRPRPSMARPTLRMRRHLEGLGVPTAGLSGPEARRVQRALHHRSKAGLATYRQLQVLTRESGGLAEWDRQRLLEVRRENWRGVLEAAVAEHRAGRFLARDTGTPESGPGMGSPREHWNVLLTCVQRTRKQLAFRLAAAGHAELYALVAQVKPADIESMVERGDRDELTDAVFLRRLEDWSRSRIRDEERRLPEVAPVTDDDFALHRSRCEAFMLRTLARQQEAETLSQAAQEAEDA